MIDRYPDKSERFSAGIFSAKRLAMTWRRLSIFTFFYLFLLIGAAMAAPIRAIGPLDISGTISGMEWITETNVKGNPGMSGSAGHDRTRPAHFLITLTD